MRRFKRTYIFLNPEDGDKFLRNICIYNMKMGGIVEALGYKPEGHGFDSR
jgi:hypothetical protein